MRWPLVLLGTALAAGGMAGVVERVDATHWRIAFPFPAYESVVDLLELEPVAP